MTDVCNECLTKLAQPKSLGDIHARYVDVRTPNVDEMTDAEYRGHFGQPRSTDDYVAMARRHLAQSAALAGVPGAVLDIGTESAISRMLGPDLTAAVGRVRPGMTLSAWVSKFFGSIDALGKALGKYRTAGSPVNLSANRAMDPKSATAVVVGLEMNRR